MKRFILLFVALVTMTNVMAQLQPGDPIPMDPNVRYGKLENGMTYYIRHNEKPKNLANFYILHNVGAIQEEDSQQGLAHFLEHMAFNGTKNMPGKTMIEYLERNGVKFGNDLNAYTSFDETCYNLDNVPTTNPGVIDTALLILHDWSHFITLDPQEIDNERGVIKEELRTRDGASWRGMIKRFQAVNKGTKYEQRNIIGYLDQLQSFDYQDLRDFYNKWYRPEYQGIVVVGDINVDSIEMKIKTLMSDIPASPADAAQKETYPVPDNEEPILNIFADPENTSSVVYLFIKRPALPNQFNNLVLREQIDLLDTYVSLMAGNRISEISMQPDAPFLGGYMAIGDILHINPLHDEVTFIVQTREGEILRGYEALVSEMEKIRRYGFTQSEFDRAKAELLSQVETIYANRNDRDNSYYVSRYLESFKTNCAIPDAETSYNLDKQLLDQITLADVNTWAESLITPNNQIISVEVPEKEGLTTPTAEEILNVRTTVMNAEVEAYEDTTVQMPLIPENVKLKGSKVKKSIVNEEMGTTEWILKNGAKVIVKPTQLKADEVLLSVSADGGAALLPDELVMTAQFLPVISSMSGVGQFSATELEKQMAGKRAAIGLSVDTYRHGMSGYSTPKDLETLLQLLYLNFTAPRFSEEDFNTTITTYRSYVENQTSNPSYIMQRETLKTLYNNSPRVQTLTPEALDNMTFESLQGIYSTLYPGANGFTFTIVGNVDLETLKPLVEKYIGSIPSNKKALSYQDDGVRTATGEVVNTFTTPMIQPKVSELFLLTAPVEFDMHNEQVLQLLQLALRTRYTESVREEKGGTYGVSVYKDLTEHPIQQAVMQIAYDTNEAMADELAPIIIEEIETIANDGPNTENIEASREYMIKEFNSALESNNSWISILDSYYRHNQNLPANYVSSMQAITYDEISAMAKKLLDSGNLIHVTMRPEKAASEE